MAKENEEKKMNFFYLEDEEELKTKKTVVRKRIKGRENNKENKKEDDDEKFSFQDEIVLGVTKQKKEIKKNNEKKDIKKNGKKNNKKDTQKKQANNKKNKNNKQTKKEIVKEDINKQYNPKNIQKKKKITRVVKYSSLLILVIAVAVIALFSPLFNIKKIDVEGNNKITNNEIISLSQIQLDENMFKINKKKVVNQIKENAYINTVNIIRRLPSSIIIKIQERTPMYLLEYAGSYIYVDKQGYLLEISTEKMELPILQGAATDNSKFVVGKRLDREDLEKLEITYKIIEIAKANDIYKDISRIDIENIDNIKLIFEQTNKVAYIGDNSNLLDKIIMIKKIIEQEGTNAGEIFVNMDLNKENPIFRQTV